MLTNSTGWAGVAVERDHHDRDHRHGLPDPLQRVRHTARSPL